MKSDIQDGLATALLLVAKRFNIDTQALNQSIELNRSKNPIHGDFTSNIALKYAKTFGIEACDLADMLVVSVPLMNNVAGLEVASSGFINIRLTKESITAVLQEIVEKKNYFANYCPSHRQNILITFGHIDIFNALPAEKIRSTVYAASLAKILAKNGHQVHTQFYINDAERDMEILLLSVFWRYVQICGQDIDLVEKLASGERITAIAKQIKSTYGKQLNILFSEWLPAYAECAGDDDWVEQTIEVLKVALDDYDRFFNTVKKAVIDALQRDLALLGIDDFHWTSQRSWSINHMMNKLEHADFLYKKNKETWLSLSKTDEKENRLMCDKNGYSTAFAYDVAHYYERYEHDEYHLMIDIVSTEFHDDMNALKAALTAAGVEPKNFYASLVQPVKIRQGKKKKRFTLKGLSNRFDIDALKFFHIMRKSVHQLDIDLNLLASSSMDNPFYCVQYAHVRCCQILENAKKSGYIFDAKSAVQHRGSLHKIEEKALLRELARYTDVVETAGDLFSPQIMVTYLGELANTWHQFYDAEHTILDNNEAVRQARLLLTFCVKHVLCDALNIINIFAQEKM